MANFDIAFNLTMGHEGGYVNHSSDPGGETYRGITRRDHPNWSGWTIVDRSKVSTAKGILLSMNVKTKVDLDAAVSALYKGIYWDSVNGDIIRYQEIANELFDTAVNMGATWAGTFLQRALNVTNRKSTLYPNLKPDGDIGNKTITALHANPDPSLVLKIMNILQGARYVELCEKNEKLEDFIKGWINQRVK